MKITRVGTFFRNSNVVIFSIFCLLLGSSCENTSDDGLKVDIIGTWHQIARTVDDVSTPKDSTRLLMQINPNNICIFGDSSMAAIQTNQIIYRSGWSYSDDLLNIAIDLPASWKPFVDNELLVLERVDFNQNGTLRKTILTFRPLDYLEIK